MDSKFDLVYLPEELEDLGDQLEEEDMNRLFYMSPVIDLLDVVLEQVNLTCQGLCPVCGKSEKDGECHCVKHDSDSQLDILKIFLRDKR